MFNAKNLLLFKGYHKFGGGGKHSQNRICLCALIVFIFSCVLILSNLMVYYSAGGFNRFVFWSTREHHYQLGSPLGSPPLKITYSLVLLRQVPAFKLIPAQNRQAPDFMLDIKIVGQWKFWFVCVLCWIIHRPVIVFCWSFSDKHNSPAPPPVI